MRGLNYKIIGFLKSEWIKICKCLNKEDANYYFVNLQKFMRNIITFPIRKSFSISFTKDKLSTKKGMDFLFCETKIGAQCVAYLYAPKPKFRIYLAGL